MEKEQPETKDRVPIPKAAFDGLEFIRQSGATNMLDRPMVLNLAWEWDFTETANWIESVGTATYAQLIFQGPEVIENDPSYPENKGELFDQDSAVERANPDDENDAFNDPDEIDLTEIAFEAVRRDMQDLITTLGKQAILTIADTYETEHMGVLFPPNRRDIIHAERNALIRNLGQASSSWLQLEKTMIEVHRGVGSLRYLTDPENN
jgi:hypothetical protein